MTCNCNMAMPNLCQKCRAVVEEVENKEFEIYKTHYTKKMSYSEVTNLIEEKGAKAALDLLIDNFYTSKREMEEAEKAFKNASVQAAMDTSSLKHFLLKASRDKKGEAIENDGYVISHTRSLKTYVLKISGDNLTVAAWPIIQD